MIIHGLIFQAVFSILQMKKSQFLIYTVLFSVVILINAVVCLSLTGTISFADEYASVIEQNANENGKWIYVCGAVEKEGYYYAMKGDTEYSLIMQADPCDNYAYDFSYNETVDIDNVSLIAVGFYVGNQAFSPLDVNGASFAEFAETYGITQTVINSISNYKETYGSFTSKAQLQTLLGGEYDDYYFMLYVGGAVNEAVS